MAAKQSVNPFGRKLNWLKTTFRITDGEIGSAVGASAPLVCRWRSGERVLDRSRDIAALKRLAEFFAKRAVQSNHTYTLTQALDVDEADITNKNDKYYLAFVDFIYSASPLPTISKADDPGIKENLILSQQTSFFGMDGLLSSLDILNERLQGTHIGITVYLSLEYSRIIRDSSASELWETLWRLGGNNPVRLVFDNWTDAGEAMKTLRGLLPFMQNGRLRLHLIKSTQKYFYSNISFYADGVGMVITAEPASGFGDSISMLVESPDYIKGMGGVFARFDKNSKPIEKHLNMAATKDEAAYIARLFEPGSDLKTVIDGLNLLYMDADAYMKLLKLNGVIGSQRAYRLERFENDKRQFNEFLGTGRVTELFSIPAFERIVASQELKTPDFSFHAGAIKADREILKSLLRGMIDCLGKYENLTIYLNRRALPYPNFSLRLKGDSFVLLHSYENGVPHAVWSDTWLLVYEYIRQFDEALLDGDLVTSREAVLSALKMRLERLGGV